METEVIEQVAFPASIPITKFDASVIAPFFPPLMRGAVVVNTEKDKNLDVQPVPGKTICWLFGINRMAQSRTMSSLWQSMVLYTINPSSWDKGRWISVSSRPASQDYMINKVSKKS